jgi:hypothetical protein
MREMWEILFNLQGRFKAASEGMSREIGPGRKAFGSRYWQQFQPEYD